MDSSRFIKINNKELFSIFTDSGNKKLVIFCHGFRGDSTGPNRYFVRLARRLQEKGISSLRFDQYANGNSEGDFENASFNNWVDTTFFLVNKYINLEYKVSLLGQSMGGSCVIVAGSKLGNKLSSIVAWTPGIIADEPKVQGKYMYESGQRVKWKFWEEAYKANISECFTKLKVNTYTIFATKDEHVPLKDQEKIIKTAKSHQKIDILKDEVHSKWAYGVSEKVLSDTTSFLSSNFK